MKTKNGRDIGQRVGQLLVCMAAIAIAPTQLRAQGLTDYKEDKGAGPITGSAGAAGTAGAPVSLQKCQKSLGTIAISEPQDEVTRALQRFTLPPPTGLLRLMIAQSGCFQVVERGTAMRNILQERELAAQGGLNRNANMGSGQLVAADYVLTPAVAFSESNAGGVSAGLMGFGALLGPIGMLAGALAAGLKFKQAQTSILIADTRTGLQVAAAEGSVEKADFGVGGLIGGGAGLAALGAYENTAEGKVVAASFLNNWNKIVPVMQSATPVNTQPVVAATVISSAAAAVSTGARNSFIEGSNLIPKIPGVRLYAKPDKKSKTVMTLTRTDEVVVLGEESGEFVKVHGTDGSGWVEKLLMRTP